MFHPDKFDLVLMDIKMPVMNRISATKELRKKYNNLPPFVGLSANTFEGDREKYIGLGLDEYLTKPLKKGELNEMLKNIFQPQLANNTTYSNYFKLNCCFFYFNKLFIVTQ